MFRGTVTNFDQTLLMNHGIDNTATRSVGFPRSQTTGSLPADTSASLSSATPSSRKLRPKGRWFVSLVLGSLIIFVVYGLWHEFFHFTAYGQLTGHVIALPAKAEGVVKTLPVQEGDYVTKGTVLATVDARKLEVERERVLCQLRLALAGLQVRAREVESRKREFDAEQLDREMRYFELRGAYVAKRTQLEKLAADFASNVSLRKHRAISESTVLASKVALEAREAELAELRQAIERFKDFGDPSFYDTQTLLVADRQRIGGLQSQLEGLNHQLVASRIRAPFDGKVTRTFFEAGEYVREGDAVLELLARDSLEAVVYCPQMMAAKLEIGDRMNLKIKARPTAASC